MGSHHRNPIRFLRNSQISRTSCHLTNLRFKTSTQNKQYRYIRRTGIVRRFTRSHAKSYPRDRAQRSRDEMQRPTSHPLQINYPTNLLRNKNYHPTPALPFKKPDNRHILCRHRRPTSPSPILRHSIIHQSYQARRVRHFLAGLRAEQT
jgi:hypothetical protein